MFRARLPSISLPPPSTCHKMPRLPRNLQLVATWRSPANAICKKTLNTTRLKWCACQKNDDAHVQSAAPATKTAHLLKTSQKYCACHTKRFSTRYKTPLNVTKCHACHAKRSNETFETSKNDHLCRTYHRERLLRIPEKVEFAGCWFCPPPPPPPSPSIGVGNLPERNRRTGEVWFCRGSHTIWSAGSWLNSCVPTPV